MVPASQPGTERTAANGTSTRTRSSPKSKWDLVWIIVLQSQLQQRRIELNLIEVLVGIPLETLLHSLLSWLALSGRVEEKGKSKGEMQKRYSKRISNFFISLQRIIWGTFPCPHSVCQLTSRNWTVTRELFLLPNQTKWIKIKLAVLFMESTRYAAQRRRTSCLIMSAYLLTRSWLTESRGYIPNVSIHTLQRKLLVSRIRVGRGWSLHKGPLLWMERYANFMQCFSY